MSGGGTLEPVYVAELLPELHAELLGLLRGLSPEDWNRPTSAERWRVRDVAAHLLDVDIRRLAAGRDGHPPPAPQRPLDDYEVLRSYLDGLNEDWIRAARRISPPILIDFLASTGPQLAQHLASIDPSAPALYPVAWAGEEASTHWFDVGREYLERWHHQDQVREAVGAPGLIEPKWLTPLVALSLRCLPHAYRTLDAEPGTTVSVRVTGSSGIRCTLLRTADGWTLRAGEPPEEADCVLVVDAARAARLLLRGREEGEDGRTDASREGEVSERLERHGVRVQGDGRLAAPFLAARALMV